MKSKKAQLTVIIIVAIVIVVAVAGGFYISSQNKKAVSEEYFNQASIKTTIDSIKLQTVDCVKTASEESLDSIGVQGGYYDKPSKIYETGNTYIPYYYNEGEYLQPTKEQIELELSKQVNENIENCLNQISKSDYKISHKKSDIKTTIKEGELTFTINQETQIIREGHTTIIELEQHTQTIPSELNAMIDLANYITESHKEDPELYCVSCVAEIAEKDKLFVDIIEFGDNEMQVIISETHTRSEPYSFQFLNKYTGNEESSLGDINNNIPTPPSQ
jgi:hypothetical protein